MRTLHAQSFAMQAASSSCRAHPVLQAVDSVLSQTECEGIALYGFKALSNKTVDIRLDKARLLLLHACLAMIVEFVCYLDSATFGYSLGFSRPCSHDLLLSTGRFVCPQPGSCRHALWIDLPNRVSDGLESMRSGAESQEGQAIGHVVISKPYSIVDKFESCKRTLRGGCMPHW
jgi:hypothetical protein